MKTLFLILLFTFTAFAQTDVRVTGLTVTAGDRSYISETTVYIGMDNAQGVSVRVTVPAGSQVLSVTPSGCVTESESSSGLPIAVNCALGNMAVDDTAIITVTTNRDGGSWFSAYAKLSVIDIDPSNNFLANGTVVY